MINQNNPRRIFEKPKVCQLSLTFLTTIIVTLGSANILPQPVMAQSQSDTRVAQTQEEPFIKKAMPYLLLSCWILLGSAWWISKQVAGNYSNDSYTKKLPNRHTGSNQPKDKYKIQVRDIKDINIKHNILSTAITTPFIKVITEEDFNSITNKTNLTATTTELETAQSTVLEIVETNDPATVLELVNEQNSFEHKGFQLEANVDTYTELDEVPETPVDETQQKQEAVIPYLADITNLSKLEGTKNEIFKNSKDIAQCVHENWQAINSFPKGAELIRKIQAKIEAGGNNSTAAIQDLSSYFDESGAKTLLLADNSHEQTVKTIYSVFRNLPDDYWAESTILERE